MNQESSKGIMLWLLYLSAFKDSDCDGWRWWLMAMLLLQLMMSSVKPHTLIFLLFPLFFVSTLFFFKSQISHLTHCLLSNIKCMYMHNTLYIIHTKYSTPFTEDLMREEKRFSWNPSWHTHDIFSSWVQNFQIYWAVEL